MTLDEPTRATLRDAFLRTIPRTRLRHRTRVSLGFGEGATFNEEVSSTFLRTEIEDFRMLDSVWTKFKKTFEIAPLALPDRALASFVAGLRYPCWANLCGFKANAPPWIAAPNLDAELATYYEREVTTVQGSRALQCFLEYVDLILSVYTQEPADESEASALVETYGLFFDASRASRAYEWSPELRPRVEKTRERIRSELTGAVAAGGTRAVTAGLAWIAWRAGQANQLEGNAGLKTEHIQLLERLRRDRVTISETRVRELFYYFYPDGKQPSYGRGLPFPEP